VSLDTFFSGTGWLTLALVLGALELAAPGAVFLWLALAAGATALLVYLVDPAWQVQLAIYAPLAIASVVLGRRYFKKNPIVTQDSGLNRRADRLVGQVYPLIEAIRHGQGKVQIGDAPWLVEGPDLPKGSDVRVVRVDGSKLIVEAA
jgi:inner membrane protein